MYGPGPGHGWGLGLFWHIGAFIGGLVIALAIIALAFLLVRYLIVATRAAQLYVDAHSAPGSAPAATEPPPDVPKGPPRPRTPKTPPAV